MKIAIISSLFAPFGIGGAEQVAAELAEAFHAEGDSVNVVSTCRRKDLAGKSYGVELWNGIRVWRIAPWNFYWRFDREQECPSQMIRAAWHFVDLWNPTVINPLTEVLQQIRPDVVNTHNIDGFSPVVWQVARRHSSAVIHTLHDYHLVCPRAVMQRRDGALCERLCTTCRVYAAYHHRFQNCVDALIAPSREIADVHLAAGWRVPTVVVPNGVNLPEAPPLETTRQETNTGLPLQIVFMSRLVAEKGCESMLRTIEHFRDCRDIHFHVAGKGPYEDKFRQLEKSVSNFTWHGYVSGVSKTALLSAGDVFLQLSEWRENAPLALLEAKRCGLYLIGTNVGGIPEIITSSEEGELIPAADTAGLSSRLRDLVTKRDLLRAQRSVRAARSRVYDVREMGRQYLSVFSSAGAQSGYDTGKAAASG